jgi:hypothetical protein
VSESTRVCVDSNQPKINENPQTRRANRLGAGAGVRVWCAGMASAWNESNLNATFLPKRDLVMRNQSRIMQTPRLLGGALHALSGAAIGDASTDCGGSVILRANPPKSSPPLIPRQAMPSEARKYSGARPPDPQNRDMAVPGCRVLTALEAGSKRRLTPDRVAGSSSKTNRRAWVSGRWASGSRHEHWRYSRSDLERVPSYGRRVSGSGAMGK